MNKTHLHTRYTSAFTRSVLLCLSLFLFCKAEAQIITTYAGTGIMGYSGDGGPALQAQMIAPFDLAFDKAGNLYVADNGNNAIRKIDAVTKVMNTVVGGGTNYGNCVLKDAALTNPRGIAFDKDDNLYIADASTYIRKVNFAAQTITTIAGRKETLTTFVELGDGGSALDAHFDGIAGMATDAGGNLYVADMLNFRIRRIDAKTNIVTTYAGEVRGNSVPTVQMNLNQVLDVAVDKEGNVYIPDQGMIRKIDAVTHEVTTLAGRLYHGEYSGDGGPASDATLSPIGVAVDNDHNIYVTDWGNQRVRKIDGKTNIISTIAGNGTQGYAGDCGPSEQSVINWPWAIITDNIGQAFFTDWHNYVVRKIAGTKPNVISGANTLCLFDSVLLKNEATGGVWASSNTAIATVSDKGLVRSLATGITDITYTVVVEGCSFTTSKHTVEVKSVDENSAAVSSQHTCIGNAVLLSGFAGNGIWLSNDSSVAFVSSSGYISSLQKGTAELKYLVQDQCAVTGKVTVQVFQPQTLLIGNDTSFCSNESLLLNAGNGFNHYQWNTGDVSSSITVNAPGIYSIAATDANQCIVTDSLTILQVFDTSAIGWQPVSALCKGSPLLLSVPSDAVSVLWQDFSSGQTLAVTQPGTYWVRISNSHHCISSDTMVIDKEVEPPANFLPADTTLCFYDTWQLVPAASFAAYQWSTGSTMPSITIEEGGMYSLQVTDLYHCTGTDSITVSKKTCYNNIYFPNAFTPNGDGANDFFKPKVYGSLLQFSMVLYNRWGKKVFETNNWQQGWNGRTGSVLQDAGSYIWQATYQLPNDIKRSAKGVLVLLR